jgi:hypothetical protein
MLMKIVLWALVVAFGLMWLSRRSANRNKRAGH